MFIDAHVYCLPPGLREPDLSLPKTEQHIVRAIYTHPESQTALSLASPEAIKTSMEKSEIDRSVLVAFPWYDTDRCRWNNEYLLECADKDNRFYCICALQPKERDFHRHADECIRAGAIGFKVNAVWQGLVLDGPEMIELATYAAEQRIPVMIHVDHAFRKSSASAAAFYSLAKKQPETKWIAAHLGGLLGLYSLLETVRRHLDNVWFDTAVSSTLQMVRFYTDVGLAHKLIFGTDFPFNHSHSQAQVLAGIKALQLGTDVESAILGNNFLSLFNLMTSCAS